MTNLSRLKPGGRRSEKAALEGRKDVCILVHATWLYVRIARADTHAWEVSRQVSIFSLASACSGTNRPASH